MKVQPRNYLLLACHAFNEAAQLSQLRRGYLYEKANRKEGEKSAFNPLTFGATCAGLGAAGVIGPRFKVIGRRKNSFGLVFYFVLREL